MNKYLTAKLLPFTFLLIAGCNSMPNAKNTSHARAQAKAQPAQTVSQQASAAMDGQPKEQDPVKYCRQALSSLKKINPDKAAKFSASLKDLVDAASKYNSVRQNINGDTRQAVDAMYQFKTAKLCADVDKELMDSLLTSGEKTVR